LLSRVRRNVISTVRSVREGLLQPDRVLRLPVDFSMVAFDGFDFQKMAPDDDLESGATTAFNGGGPGKPKHDDEKPCGCDHGFF
jgi:hypothetical protein